jgi:sugar/nucleoside kinase (ribokinase family)
MTCGLFVGLITLDFIYLVDQVPASNQKIVAREHTIAAGGPATNAAVAFSYLSRAGESKRDRTTVLGSLGTHPMAQLIRADLQECNVAIADLSPTRSDSPPVSSILVTESTGERAVISINAVNAQVSRDAIPANMLQDVEVVLIDGHQMAVGEAIAQQASDRQIPVVIDAGSWKLGFERVLPYATYVICSANFRPPACHTQTEVCEFLKNLGVSHIAITQGEQPIRYCTPQGSGDIPVPSITSVDTLGAGDIFHGAFCYFILHAGCTEALSQAAAVASRACQYFGTRQWCKM